MILLDLKIKLTSPLVNKIKWTDRKQNNSNSIYFVGKDTPPYFENPVVLSESFGFGSIDFDYTTFNKYPRMIADVDGDGKDDVIGFEEDGVFVAFSNGRANLETKILVCAHFTPT